MGDIDELAHDIEKLGLLSPVIITSANELVDGQRRIMAVSKLGWTDIDAHVISISEIIEGELSANEMRKSFTPSERKAITYAIMEKMNDEFGERRGGDVKSEKARNQSGRAPTLISGRKTRDLAAKKAGLGSEKTMRRVEIVEQSGRQDIIDKMNSGEISIDKAEQIVSGPKPRSTKKKVADANIYKLPAPTIHVTAEQEASERMYHWVQQFQNSFIGRESPNNLLKVMKADKRRYVIDRLPSLIKWLQSIDLGERVASGNQDSHTGICG